TNKHQKDSGIEDPIRQRPNTSISQTQREDDRDKHSENDQGPRATIPLHTRRSPPAKPGNQHRPEELAYDPDEVGGVEQNEPQTRREYWQGYQDESHCLSRLQVL